MKVFYLFISITLISLVSLKTINLRGKKKMIILAEENLENIRKNILLRHNYYRKRHQVGDLAINSDLEAIAQAYSEKLTAEDAMYHSGNSYNGKPLGENLFSLWSSKVASVTGTDATDAWYNEVSKYDFENPGYKEGIGHFSQLVWKDSKQIGCGAACQDHTCTVTCNYYPAGNYRNQFAENVFPPIE